jgi:hypothetical protein
VNPTVKVAKQIKNRHNIKLTYLFRKSDGNSFLFVELSENFQTQTNETRKNSFKQNFADYICAKNLIALLPQTT